MSEQTDTTVQEKQAIEKKTTDIAMQALTLVIKDQKTFDQSTALMEAIKGMKKQIVDFIKPIKEAANKTHKTACAQEKKLTEPLDEATDTLKAARLAYARPPAPPPPPAPTAQNNGATVQPGPVPAQPDGDGFFPINAPAIPAPSAVATQKAAETMTIKKYWYAEVTDLMALVKAVAEGRAAITLLAPNQKELNSLAVAFQDTTKVDGVAFKYREGESF